MLAALVKVEVTQSLIGILAARAALLNDATASLSNRIGKGIFCFPLATFGRPIFALIVFVYEKSLTSILLSVYGKSR